MLSINDLPKNIKNKVQKNRQKIFSKTLKKPQNMPKFEIIEDANIIHIILETKAIPKGRPRIAIDELKLLKALSMGKKGLLLAKQSISLKTPKNTKDYESFIQYAGYIAMKNKECLEQDFGIHVIIQNPRQYSDIDNCLKAIMDGLNLIAYKDDKKVKLATVLFKVGEPKIIIKVFSYSEDI